MPKSVSKPGNMQSYVYFNGQVEKGLTVTFRQLLSSENAKDGYVLSERYSIFQHDWALGVVPQGTGNEREYFCVFFVWYGPSALHDREDHVGEVDVPNIACQTGILCLEGNSLSVLEPEVTSFSFIPSVGIGEIVGFSCWNRQELLNCSGAVCPDGTVTFVTHFMGPATDKIQQDTCLSQCPLDLLAS